MPGWNGTGGARALVGAWASTSALFLSGLFVPVAGAVLMLFTPQPGLSLARQGGGTSGLLLLVSLVALTAGATGGAGFAFGYLAVFALLTIALAVGLRLEWSIERTVATGTLVQIVALATLLFTWVASPVELFDLLHAGLDRARERFLEIYGQTGVEKETLEDLRGSSAAAVDVLARLVPGLSIVAAGMIVLLNVNVIRWRQRARQLPPEFGDLTIWKAPDPLVWLLIAAGYGVFVPEPSLRWGAANLLVVVLAVYFCQGLAILAFWFRRWEVRPWVRAIVYGLLVVEWMMVAGVALLGVFDLWRDFRSLEPKPDTDDDEDF